MPGPGQDLLVSLSSEKNQMLTVTSVRGAAGVWVQGVWCQGLNPGQFLVAVVLSLLLSSPNYNFAGLYQQCAAIWLFTLSVWTFCQWLLYVRGWVEEGKCELPLWRNNDSICSNRWTNREGKSPTITYTPWIHPALRAVWIPPSVWKPVPVGLLCVDARMYTWVNWIPVLPLKGVAWLRTSATRFLNQCFYKRHLFVCFRGLCDLPHSFFF